MPEDKVDDQKKGDLGPQPGINAEMIRQAVGDALADWTPPRPQSNDDVEPGRRPEPSGSTDPLADLIGSRVNPALKQLGYAAADAKDAAMFYIEHPEMVKHKKDIEEAFSTLMKQGQPMSREAVAAWYKGKNFDKFREDANKADQEAAERAKAAADTGGGAYRERTAQTKDPHTMSDEDLAKSLEGVAF